MKLRSSFTIVLSLPRIENCSTGKNKRTIKFDSFLCSVSLKSLKTLFSELINRLIAREKKNREIDNTIYAMK